GGLLQQPPNSNWDSPAGIGPLPLAAKELSFRSAVDLAIPGRSTQEVGMMNPRSTAHIAGHPIHPMLIPFPIAFFVATFVCDLAFWQTGNPAWATAAIWLLGAGLVMAGLAALAGLTDLIGEPRIRALNAVWWHAGGKRLAVPRRLASAARLS